MKQIKEMLDRHFAGKPRLQRKWRAFGIPTGEPTAIQLQIYHYHHLILVYNLVQNQVIYQWWEKPADKRGLDACLAYLKERKEAWLESK